MKILESLPSAQLALFADDKALAAYLLENPCVRVVSTSQGARSRPGEHRVILATYESPEAMQHAQANAALADAQLRASYIKHYQNKP